MTLLRSFVIGLACAAATHAARADLTFEPALGYAADVMWSGANGAHFAVDGSSFYIFGTEQVAADRFQNIVRLYDGASTVEIARSAEFAASVYSPDAITAVGGDVYWAQVRNFSVASVMKTSFDGGSWTTTTVLDESAGVNVYSLSTDGNRVFGVGLDERGTNVAFYFDDEPHFIVLAEIPGFSGGSGFDSAGNLYAGASDGAFVPHVYKYSAAQIADRLDGTQPIPYTAAEALEDLVVPGNASAVMESDGHNLFGSRFNPSFTGSDPYAFDLTSHASTVLGTLSGAAESVTTDLYARDGSVYFMGKNGFGSGTEAVIYRLVPEPTSLAFILGGVAMLSRRGTRRCAGRKAGHGIRRASTGAAFGTVVTATAALGQSPFAVYVVDYYPAPGQFVNRNEYSDPARALGPPVGESPTIPVDTSLVSLGGFGGSLTLGFDHAVTDDAANPFGLDCIVFGNAHWVAGDPNRKWAECGIIEISRDANSNGVADDPWFLIPGSHITDPAGQYEIQTWDDDIADPTHPPDNPTWIPPGRSGTWTTEGYRLPGELFDVAVLVNPLGLDAFREGVSGYADLSPTQGLIEGQTAEVLYTRPDDAFEVGLTDGAGGGDAFDIAWAVDPISGAAARLDRFDFLRITTGVNFIAGVFGEVSTEIDAAADVAEGALGDVQGDGDIDIADYAVVSACLGGPGAAAPSSPCRVVDFDQDGDVDLADIAGFQVEFDAP